MKGDDDGRYKCRLGVVKWGLPRAAVAWLQLGGNTALKMSDKSVHYNVKIFKLVLLSAGPTTFWMLLDLSTI